MQGRDAAHAGEQRILMIGMLWLFAGLTIYVLAGQPWSSWLRPGEYRFPVALDPFTGPFPTFAHTVALSLLSVWFFRCSRDSALVVCVGWWLVEAAFEFGKLSEVSSRILPLLPEGIRHAWLVDATAEWLARGSYQIESLAAAALGSGFAYLTVLNSIPEKKRV
jgi:hypothetical protein